MVALLELMGSEGPHSAQLRSMDQGWPMSDQAVSPDNERKPDSGNEPYRRQTICC